MRKLFVTRRYGEQLPHDQHLSGRRRARVRTAVAVLGAAAIVGGVIGGTGTGTGGSADTRGPHQQHGAVVRPPRITPDPKVIKDALNSAAAMLDSQPEEIAYIRTTAAIADRVTPGLHLEDEGIPADTPVLAIVMKGHFTAARGVMPGRPPLRRPVVQLTSDSLGIVGATQLSHRPFPLSLAEYGPYISCTMSYSQGRPRNTCAWH